MKTAGLCRDELHVFEEDGNHREARFLGDVVKARLAGPNMNAIAASAFGKNHEMKFAGSAAKILQFANAARIQFASFQEETDAAAEEALNPGGMPDGFVAKNEDGVAAGAPAKSA